MALSSPALAHPSAYWNDILGDPTNDTPRLRYAKWLDAQGDPLGEFIRIQCRLARWPKAPEAWSWECREQELLADFEEQWTEPIAGLVEWWTFRRGFVEEVSLTAEGFLRHASELFANAPILEIHLRYSREHVEALCQCHWLLRLRHLDLSNNYLRDCGVELLAQSPFLVELESLNLSTACLGDRAVQALAASPFLKHLRELYLCDNDIGAAGVKALMEAPFARQLDMLHLRFNNLDAAAVAQLRRVFGARVQC
ncbi:MAG: TIGR02996 domain-containing protein [Gemmataceae bacterium]|nr:TIGR02996 domain-containing protein [Gemmataceae bacterium]